MANNNVSAVILAAGCGKRMGASTTKQRLVLMNKSVLRHTLEAFNECVDVNHIIIVARHDELSFAIEESAGIDKVRAIVIGGKTRAESARIGFNSIPSDSDFVAIHDAARCLITPEDISLVISDAKKYGAASAATSVSDTVKTVDADGFVSGTIPRCSVKLAATPQIFSTSIYNKALCLTGVEIGEEITDDNMLVERSGIKVRITEISSCNIKITRPGDLKLAEFILNRRQK